MVRPAPRPPLVSMSLSPTSTPRGRLFLAFAITYLVWGTTYAAIRIGVQAWPPLLFVGSRFTFAGLVLLIVAGIRGERVIPRPPMWIPILVLAILLIAVSNGLASWGEVTVPSDQTALLGATTALWIAGLGAMGPSGTPLDRRGLRALIIGLVGTVLLLYPVGGWSTAPLSGDIAITLSNVSWAVGVIYGRRPRVASIPLFTGAAWQLLLGGTILLVLGFSVGEGRVWAWSLPGFLTMAYLALFASSLTYTVYLWLVPRVTPLSLGSINYVNPLIAVVCGWVLLDERLDAIQVAGAATILISVVLIVWPGSHRTGNRVGTQTADPPGTANFETEGTRPSNHLESCLEGGRDA